MEHQHTRFSFHSDLLAEKPAVNTLSGQIIQTLYSFIQNGHVCVHEAVLIDTVVNRFYQSADFVKRSIEKLQKSNEIIIDVLPETSILERIIYLPPFYYAEKGFSKRFHAFLTIPVHIKYLKINPLLPEIELKMLINLSAEQRWILSQILRYKTSIVTGCPGTGKTTLTRSICLLLKRLNQEIALAAPTGRAAQRLSELTQFKAQTIHRLLAYHPDKNVFGRNELNPLDVDAIIIDEFSMVDILLIYHLIKATPMNAILIFVGDRFQLPSVGPGNVLKDLIASGRLPVFSLNTVFRHGENTTLAQNAILINQGKQPNSTKMRFQYHRSNTDSFPELHLTPIQPTETSDPHFIFVEEDRVEMILQGILWMCQTWIPQKFGFDPVHDIQVMTPMHKGSLGTNHLNFSLQKHLNPADGFIVAHGRKFKSGDKVMHLKNNYEKEVYNGDIGIIHEINPLEQICRVNYQGRLVSYTIEELKELSLAYAITVHKSQGSEYPAIILPVVTQHYIMLQRNLLYTAVTRGKKLVCVIGSEKALNIALKNNRQETRYTLLSKRLKSKEGRERLFLQ
ncbi:MAG: AAA family ATPase [Candidatus Magnetomorum sp.]|nr:AAA family ATPase [Candidatus Magnetomorum sp.]